MSATVREARMMEQRMVPPALRICQQPRARLPYGQTRPLFHLEIAQQHGARAARLFSGRRFCALSRFRPRPTSPSPRRKALSHSFVDSPAAICHNTIKSGRQFQKVDGSGGIV